VSLVAPVPDLQRWMPLPPRVPAELVLRLQRYRDMARVPRGVRLAAEAAAQEVSGLIRPEARLWRGAVTRVEPAGTVVLAGAHEFHSAALARLLAGSDEAYVVVLTLGAAVEERARALLTERMALEALLLDTAAWAGIELLIRDLRRHLLARERPAGRAVTHRLGPGHRDWAVSEQAALLGVFGAAPLPVSVNESACMLPRKSISGAYGIVAAGHRGRSPEAIRTPDTRLPGRGAP
jgi:hypothetical protein